MASGNAPKQSPEVAIRTDSLTKIYNTRAVVNDVNLLLQRGETYGLLGPNGAGKTTTLRMILGLVRPTNGTVEICGRVAYYGDAEPHRNLGVVSERTFIYDDMTAWEYLCFFARVYEVKDAARPITELLERLELSDFCHLLARDFSLGMQRKLSIARALLHDPQILILDEPTQGLDPQSVVQVRELLIERRNAGKTILVSSHILSEVERTADRVGILDQGNLVGEDTVEGLRSKLTPGIQLEIEMQSEVRGLAQAIRRLRGVQSVEEEGTQVFIQVDGENDIRAAVSKTIAESGGLILNMMTRRVTLEEAFVRLIQDRRKQRDFNISSE